MIVPDPRERFAAAVRPPDAPIDLAECALLVAAEEYPDLDLDLYLERLDALADAVAIRIRAAQSDEERVAILNRYLLHSKKRFPLLCLKKAAPLLLSVRDVSTIKIARFL